MNDNTRNIKLNDCQLNKLASKKNSIEFAEELGNYDYNGVEITKLIQKYYKKDPNNPTGPYLKK